LVRIGGPEWVKKHLQGFVIRYYVLQLVFQSTKVPGNDLGLAWQQDVP